MLRARLPIARLSTRSGCSEPHQSWPWAFPGTGHPQLSGHLLSPWALIPSAPNTVPLPCQGHITAPHTGTAQFHTQGTRLRYGCRSRSKWSRSALGTGTLQHPHASVHQASHSPSSPSHLHRGRPCAHTQCSNLHRSHPHQHGHVGALLPTKSDLSAGTNARTQPRTHVGFEPPVSVHAQTPRAVLLHCCSLLAPALLLLAPSCDFLIVFPRQLLASVGHPNRSWKMSRLHHCNP